MEKKLLLNALRGNAVENFSSADVNTAALADLLKEFGIEDRPTGRQLAAHKNEMFAIIIEALDEILPKDMQNIAGQWAEVISFGRDEQVGVLVHDDRVAHDDTDQRDDTQDSGDREVLTEHPQSERRAEQTEQT